MENYRESEEEGNVDYLQNLESNLIKEKANN